MVPLKWSAEVVPAKRSRQSGPGEGVSGEVVPAKGYSGEGVFRRRGIRRSGPGEAVLAKGYSARRFLYHRSEAYMI